MLTILDRLMHYIRTRHSNFTYVSKFQVNTITIIEVIRQNVFSHARVMVIGVRSDLKKSEFQLIKGTFSRDLAMPHLVR